jgi:putative FmdB family regulatory protein
LRLRGCKPLTRARRETVMPILKYKCVECGKEFAKIMFSLDDAPKGCPVCGAESPLEAGQAFSDAEGLAARRLCTSCDTCEVTGCGPTAGA